MIYLDNAAASCPKPHSVHRAVRYALDNYAANPGRSSHKEALKAANAVYDTRCILSQLFGAPAPENVIFTSNTTHALNIALYTAVKKGCKVVTSVMEHNAVLRPLYALQKERECEIRFFRPDMDNVCSTLMNFYDAARDCDVCVLTLCSNVNGYRMPIREIAEYCKKSGITLIADGAQAAGYFDIDIQKIGIDMLCIPSQKGLFGICGAGALIVGDKWCEKMEPMMTGGSGVMSQSREMPPYLPERLEAGTLATLPIVSMCAGAEFVDTVGTDELYYRSYTPAQYLREMLMNMRKVKVYPCYGSIVLFNVQNAQSFEVEKLFDDGNIAVRSGFHCAPLTHEHILTGENGAVRASFGAFNSPRDAECVVKRIKSMC
ncbi:MAG: aminotransferase class V-fold PLP-dependent enzyme [Ruminococcaceae bacterium]|nr:aminotransferase class V-fold PLP-dependent enzyme [Oscillospiraceae bacterium]